MHTRQPNAVTPPAATILCDRASLSEQIRRHNTTVEAEFLEQFSVEELQEYLDHLEAARRKQLQIAGWVKPRLKRAG